MRRMAVVGLLLLGTAAIGKCDNYLMRCDRMSGSLCKILTTLPIDGTTVYSREISLINSVYTAALVEPRN